MKYINLFILTLLLTPVTTKAQNCNNSISYYVQNNTYQATATVYTLLPFNNVNQSYSYVNWGDGTTSYIAATNSTINQSNHNYTSAGTYYTEFTSFTIDSTMTVICRDTIKDTLVVAPISSCHSSIQFSYNQTNLNTVNFQAISSGTNNTYTWDFGDGSTNATGANIIHTYSQSGLYNVILVSTDTPTNCIHTSTVQVHIVNTTDFCNVYYPSLQSAVQHNRVSFNLSDLQQQSYIPTNAAHVSILWDFGDGNTATTNTLYTSHIYGTTGTYPVSAITEWKTSANSTTVFCRDTLYDTITVSSILTTQNINGYIQKDSLIAPLMPSYKVWLIEHNTNSNTLTAIDSQIVTRTSYSHVYYSFSNISINGVYRTKAMLLNGANSGSGVVPTYSMSALLWNNALVANPAVSSQQMNITMKNGTITNGPGFVGGNVFQGANKGTSGGIANISVFLLDQQGQVIQYAVTDAQGDYSFNNIPIGTYDIYPEELGYITSPASVSISNTNTQLQDIYFERSENNKRIYPITVSVNNINSTSDILSLYPNPASGYVTMKWSGKQSAKITVTNIMGKRISIDNIAPNSNKQIDISTLTKGLYFVTVECNNQKTTQKLLVR